MTAVPPFTKLTHHVKDFRLGSYVNALSWFVEQQHVWPAMKPLADDQFLLIAARQCLGLCGKAGEVEIPILASLCGVSELLSSIDKTCK